MLQGQAGQQLLLQALQQGQLLQGQPFLIQGQNNAQQLQQQVIFIIISKKKSLKFCVLKSNPQACQ